MAAADRGSIPVLAIPGLVLYIDLFTRTDLAQLPYPSQSLSCISCFFWGDAPFGFQGKQACWVGGRGAVRCPGGLRAGIAARGGVGWQVGGAGSLSMNGCVHTLPMLKVSLF